MSELRSAIEPYRREVLAGLPDARLEEDFAELQRAAEQIEAEALRRLAEIERRRCFETDGYLSAAAWLASRFGLGWGGARQAVHLARSLEQMPAARRAMEDGEISLQAVRILAQARETKPRGVRALGSHLVEAARVHPADLYRIVAYWRHPAEREVLGSSDDVVRDLRRLHVSVTLGGMVRLRGSGPRERRGRVDGAPGGAGRRDALEGGGPSHAGAAAGRWARGGLPAVAGPLRAAHRGGRAGRTSRSRSGPRSWPR